MDLFGFSNDVGLLAAIIVLVLLLLSNDVALRLLKGKRWKRIQQWAYPLIVLTIIELTRGMVRLLSNAGVTLQAIAGGLAIPPLLMLTAYAMACRTRRSFSAGLFFWLIPR